MRLIGRIALSAMVGIGTAGLFGLLAWGFTTASFWGGRVNWDHAPPSIAALAALTWGLGFLGAVASVIGGIAAVIAAVAATLEATEV